MTFAQLVELWENTWNALTRVVHSEASSLGPLGNAIKTKQKLEDALAAAPAEKK